MSPMLASPASFDGNRVVTAVRSRVALRPGPALLLVLAGCTATTAPADPGQAPQGEAPAPTVASDDVFLVGVLDQNGVAECPQGGERTWSSITPVIGWTKVTMVDAPAESMFGYPVVATGTVIDASRERAGSSVSPECPQMQMRGDWMETPRGIRLEREPSTAGPHIRVEEILPLPELGAKEIGREVEIDLRNPVPVELTDVTLVVHYEGCHGKPGTTHRSYVHGILAVGAGMRTRFPTIVQAERAPGRPEPHRAATLQVLAKSDRAFFDLDVPLFMLGAAPTCPDRG